MEKYNKKNLLFSNPGLGYKYEKYLIIKILNRIKKEKLQNSKKSILDDDVNPNSSEVESLFINTLIMNDINYIYFLNNFDNNLNCENSGENSIDYLIKNEKPSKKEENNEVSLILISCSDSKDNDYNSENSKSTKVLDKTIPLKTKKIFKIIYSNDFTIFNFGIYDNYSNKMIYEALNDTNKNCKKIKNRFPKIFTQNQKKHQKKRKLIQKRKQNSDNIRKKIKARFLKSLKKQINQKLKSAGSKFIFTNLQQSFICNLSKEKNQKVLDLTLKELFSKNFCNEEKKNADIKKYEHNLKVYKIYKYKIYSGT